MLNQSSLFASGEDQTRLPSLPWGKVRELQDAALQRVHKRTWDWQENAIGALVPNLQELTPWKFMGEDLRPLVVPVAGEPKHSNCWGAFIKEAVNRKLIVATGEFGRTQLSSSNSRQSQYYRVHPRHLAK